MFEDILATMKDTQQRSDELCPWMKLRGHAELRATEVMTPGAFIVAEPSAEILALVSDEHANVFMHPDDIRMLEAREQAHNPFFSYMTFHTDLAAICLWLARQKREAAK